MAARAAYAAMAIPERGPTVDWITEHVAIGNYLEAQDGALLREHKFRSAVSLDGTLDEKHAALYGLEKVASYPLIDGPGNDLRVIEFALADLKTFVDRHAPVLVQCRAGRSRSAAVVAAYLMQSLGLNPAQAVAHVASRREIAIAPALVALIRKLEQ